MKASRGGKREMASKGLGASGAGWESKQTSKGVGRQSAISRAGAKRGKADDGGDD
jgi:hypothetical protein